MTEKNSVSAPDSLAQLEAQLASNEKKLSQSEQEVIKLTKLCADLMNKDLRSGGDDDSWSLGSGSGDVDFDLLKDKLTKCKQNEEYLKTQLEVLQSAVKIMVHPDDVEAREKVLTSQLSEMSTKVEQLLATNMSIKLDLSQLDELKSECKKLREIDEKKTTLIEELHDKLTTCERQNSALCESLNETENSEQSLRDSLTRIQKGSPAGEGHQSEDVARLETEKSSLLQRLNSLEEKDTRLRDRLSQVEEQELSREQMLDSLREELQLTKDINSDQEKTILDLHRQLSDMGSTDEQKKHTAKMAELEKKYSNTKLLLSQKMDELEYSRKNIGSLEKSIVDLQSKLKGLAEVEKQLDAVNEELLLVKDINHSQEQTIKQLEDQNADKDGAELAQSYHEQLFKELNAEDVEEMQAEFHREIAELKAEVDSLNKQRDADMESHDRELSANSSRIDRLEKELSKSASKLQIAQGVIDELKTQNKKLTSDSKAGYDEKLKELNLKLQGERVQNSVHRDVISSMSPQIEKLKCANESLEAELNSVKEKLNVSEMDVSKKRNEIDSLKSKSAILEKRLEDSKDVAAELERLQVKDAELTEILQQFEAKKAESDNLAVDLLQMTDKCADLEKQLSSTSTSLTQVQTDKTNLERTLEELQREVSSLQSSTDQANQLQQQLSAVQTEKSNMQENHLAEKANWKTSQKTFEQEIQSLKDQNSHDQQNIAELQALVVVAANDIKELEHNKLSLGNSLRQSQALTKTLSSDAADWQKQLKEANEKLSENKKQTTTLKDQIANLDSELAMTNRTNETLVSSLKNQIYSLTQDKSALQSRNDSLVGQVDEILSEKQVYIDEIEKLASELKASKTEYAEEKKSWKEAEDELNEKLGLAYQMSQERGQDDWNDLQKTNDQLALRVKELTESNRLMQNELQSTKSEFLELSAGQKTVDDEKEHAQVVEDYNQLRSKFDEQSKSMEKLSQDADEAQATISSLVDQLSAVKAENVVLTGQDERMNSKIQELEQGIEEERNKGIFLANKQVEKHKSEIASLQEVVSEVVAEKEELKRQLLAAKASDVAGENAKLHSRIENLRLENVQLAEALENLENEQLDQLSSSSAEACILQAQIDNMKELAEQSAKEKQLTEKLKSLSTELQAQLKDERKAHTATKSELGSIKDEQMTFKEQLEDWKEKNEHWQQRCEELEKDVTAHNLQLKELQSENEVLSEQLFLAKQECQNSKSMEAELKDEFEALKNSHALKEAKCHDTLTRVDSLETQLNAAHAELETVSEQLLSAQTELSTMKLASTESSDFQKMKSQLGDQMAVCDLAKVAASVHHSADDSLSNGLAADGQDAYIDNLQSEIEMLSTQLDSMKKENIELSAHLSELDEQLSMATLVTSEVEHLRQKYLDAVDECDQLKDSHTKSGMRCEQLSNSLNEMESGKRQAEERLDSLQLLLNSAEEEKCLLSEEVKTLLQKLESMDEDNQAALQDKDLEIQSLKQAVNDNTAEKNLLLHDEREQVADAAEESPDDSESYSATDYRDLYQQVQAQNDSMEAELREAANNNAAIKLELASLRTERDRLVSQARMSPRMDESNADGVEYRSLQRQIIELKQKLLSETKATQSLAKEKQDIEAVIENEKLAARESKAEADKLQMSISLLMTSHETEMASLQTALNGADNKMKDLETKVTKYSQFGDKLVEVVRKVTEELSFLKSSKNTLQNMLSDLIAQNAQSSEQFQQELLQRIRSLFENSAKELSSLSLSEQLTQRTFEESLTPSFSSPVPNLTSSRNVSPSKTEPLSTVSHYGQLSKSDLVAKLSDQTKHELILRKHLEEARQSLAFYRSAIDNIIDCLGTSMPSVKKWANDILNHEDQEFSQQLDALISNESALQRRCHALEISEKALAESFNTKEQEYQLAIHRLEDMVSILKSSKAKLLEEMKMEAPHQSAEVEQQIVDLKQQIYELEGNVRKLKMQNEELQFAYEQECERRQVEEEERCRADQRSRLSTIEAVRESEYLSKISSLETKISGLLAVQNDLEAKIDSLKHNSEEEELRLRIETLERSERALLRKIEILQQSDNRSGNAQFDHSLDSPEDLLRQKIWEMEKMEIHLKQQVSDLEHDREELHEIARTDKNMIHELNIQLAESTLTNKNLKAQLARLEQTEEMVSTKLDTAEAHILELEGKLKETIDNEKTMRLQLTDVEYSEDSLRFRTDNMERSLDTLQASETLLKNTIDDLTKERQQALKEMATCKARCKEVEGDQALLRNQLVEAKNREITLKGRISQLAATEASLQTRVREVELENERLTNEILHLKKSATGIRDSLTDTLMGKDELNSQIQDLKSAEELAKSKIADLEAEKFELEKKLQDVNIKFAQLQSQHTVDESGNSRLGEKLSGALAREKKARDDVVRLEGVIAAYESRQTSGVVERENFQLNAENKNLKDKLKSKERDIRDLEEKTNRLTAAGNQGGGTYRINKLQAQVKDLQVELLHSEQTRASLEELLQKVRSANHTGSCGHEHELSSLKAQLNKLKAGNNRAVQRNSGRSKDEAQKSHSHSSGKPSPAGSRPQESLRTQCLRELVEKVNKKNSKQKVEESTALPVNQLDAQNGEDVVGCASDDEAAEIASQSSIWEKLAPPVRQSPRPVMSARLTTSPQPTSPVASLTSSPTPESQHSQSDVPEESSLWEKLELVEPRKTITQPARVDIVFDEGPVAPVYNSRKSVSTADKESADEASDLDDCVVEPVGDVPQRSLTATQMLLQKTDHSNELPPLAIQSIQAMDTKDVARLKQTAMDLERKLKSRDTEIRMLRNGLKEIERESNLSGDVYTMRTKLRTLQDQVDSGEKKISELREQMIARDKNLTNRQKEVIELRVELSKLRETHAKAKEEVQSIPTSPNNQQRPISTSISPPKQSTVEQEPNQLYKSMLDSKTQHVEELTKKLEQKTSELTRLERELTSLKIDAPSVQDSSVSKFKYLDDKYTEAATRCHQMKQERDEWKQKYDSLAVELSKSQQETAGKCYKCKQLKAEIRRLQKELRASKSQPPQSSHRHSEVDDVSVSTIGEMSSLCEDNAGDGGTVPITFVHRNGDSLGTSRDVKETLGNQRLFEARLYETISDYNPKYFSTSGRASQEVHLKRGEEVKVLEQPDEKGYCRAEVNGRIHLVPMKYLQLVDSVRTEPRRLRTSTDQPASSHVSSPHRRARSFSPTKPIIADIFPESARVTHNPSSRKPRASAHASQRQTLRKPHAPANLKAEVVANQKLYIEWTYMQFLDHSAKSNGTTVQGFKVFLNGKPIKHVDSPYTAVTSIDVTRHQLAELHTVSVQALGAENTNSSLVHVAVSPFTGLDNSTSHSKDKLDLGSSPKKRLFMAYYDYDPARQGPYSKGYKSTFSDELALKTGDFIVVYGQATPNGFYKAEVNGRSGYVPEAFIRQLPAQNARKFGFHENDVFL